MASHNPAGCASCWGTAEKLILELEVCLAVIRYMSSNTPLRCDKDDIYLIQFYFSMWLQYLTINVEILLFHTKLLTSYKQDVSDCLVSFGADSN